MSRRKKRPITDDDRFYVAAAQRLIVRVNRQLSEAYPNGDYFDTVDYELFYKHVLTFCYELAAYRRRIGDLPGRYYLYDSRERRARDEVYGFLAMRMAVGLRGRGRAFTDADYAAGRTWRANLERDAQRAGELAVLSAVAWAIALSGRYAAGAPDGDDDADERPSWAPRSSSEPYI